MDLLHLVDRLEELIASAQRMPIGSRAIVDRRRLLDVIDQMRVAIPTEVREARELVERREAFRRDAEEEARLLVAQAEERAARLIDDHQLTRAARLRADELAQDAELQLEGRIGEANADIERRLDESRRLAEQQMAAADQYARELLSRLERQLEAFQRSVHSGLEQLEQPVGGEAPTPAAPPLEEAAADAAAAAARTDAILSATGSRLLDPTEQNGLGGEPAPDRSRSVLGSLLGRPAGAEPEPPAAPADPGVIDDFAMPPLDDQPSEEERPPPGSPGTNFGF